MRAAARALFAVALLAACDAGRPPVDPWLFEQAERTVEPNTTRLVTGGKLSSGFYFVVDSGYGYPRATSQGLLYIDPQPIVTAGNFTVVREDLSMQGTPVVSLELDDPGAARWQVATRKAIGGPIAIVVDDAVVSAPTVVGEVIGGRTQFDPGDSTGRLVRRYVGKLLKERQRVAPVW